MVIPETEVINSSIDIASEHLEELLEESEQRFRLMADATPVMIWMAGSDRVCNYFNCVWLEFTGCSIEQQLGNGWTQRLHPEDKQKRQTTYSTAFDTREKFQVEYRLRRADGEYRWVLDTGVPRFTPRGRFVGYVGSCVDITEQKQTQEQLRQKTAQQQLILQGFPDLYFRIDGDGTILDYNARNPDDLYVLPETFLGKRIQEVLPSSTTAQFQTSISQALQTQTSLNFEYSLPLENRERIFEATLIPQHDRQILVLIREITTHVSAEAELRCAIEQLHKEIAHRQQVQEVLTKQQQHQQLILDSVPAMIWFKDRENRTLRVNQAAATAMDLPIEQIEGKSMDDICPEEAAKYYQDDLEVMNSGLPKRGIIQPLKTASGEKRWIQTDKIPWRDDDGNITGVLVFAIDITDRQQTQMLLQDSLIRFNLAAQACQEGLWDAWVVADHPTNPNNSVYYSPRFLELLGYAETEFENTLGNWTSRIHPDDRDCVLSALEAHLKQKTPFHRIEHRLLTNSGEYRWFSASGQAIWDDAGNPVRMAGAVRDITIRKQAEDALWKSERRFHTLARVSPVGIFYTDAQGKVLYVNERWCEMAGLTPNQAAADWLQAIHPDDREQVLRKWNKAVQANLPFQSEHRFRRPDATVTWVLAQAIAELDEAGVVKGYVGTITDISDRKQVEAALQESEERFRAIFDLAAVGIALTDLEGTWLLMNQKFCDLVGYSPAEMRLRTFQEITHPEDLAVDMEYNRQLLAGEIETFSLEKRYIHKQGFEVWVNINVSLVSSPTGEPKYLIGVVQDIHDRKALEKELALRQARFDAFFTSAPVGLEIIDDQMRFVHINEILAEIDGCSPAEHIGKTIAEIVPHMASNLEATYRHVLSTGEAILNLEETGETPKQPGVLRHWISSRFPLLGEQGKPIAVGGVTVEITERKRTEEALRHSEERYRKLAQQKDLLYRIASQIRNSLNLNTILETAVAEIRNLLQIDRCFFSWYSVCGESTVWEIVHEAKPSELPSLLGCYPAEALAPLVQSLLNLEVMRVDDVQTLQDDTTRNVFQSLGYQSLLNLPIHTPSGEVGVVACMNCNSVRRWTDEEVELLSAVCDQLAIAINQAELYAQSRAAEKVATEKATQLEQALHSLQQTQAQLIQTEKMSSLGQLVAGIAHEINNPVSFIYGNVDYANAYVKDLLSILELYRTAYPQTLPEIQALAETIDLDFLLRDLPKVLFSMKVGADRIRALVLSLRNFSRLDEADKKPVDIHEGLDNTLLILQHRLKQKAAYLPIQVMKAYGQLPLVNCYPGQLNQVFMNLLTNAIDALEERRKDNSSLQNLMIRISTAVNESGDITISIADNGVGMTQDILTRLFDPFFTTKSIGKGTGLGLSISYQIVVEKHKGTIQCKSQFGKGTEFVITLPQ